MMNYFEKQEIDVLTKYSGKLKTDELQAVYDELQKTYQKIEFWASKVKEQIFPDGKVKVTKKPTNQGNLFEFYQWAKIYPTKEDFNNKILAYTVSIEKNEKLVIKIDSVGLLDNNPLRKKYYQFRKANPIVKEYYLKDFAGWDDLVKTTVKDLKGFETYYNELKNILVSQTVVDRDLNISKNKSIITPLNQILYGPPGTGKTHKLLNEYYIHFEVQNKTVSKKEFEFEIINQLSWWQVFALVLLENRSSTVPDIKKHRFVDYKLQVSNTKSLSQTVWGQLSAHTIEDSVTVQYDKRTEPLIFNKSAGSVWEIVEDKKELIDELLELSQKIRDYKEINVTSKNYKFITFHQSFSYEDFIEGIKPTLDKELSDESSEVSYAIEKGIFYECCNDAAKLAGFLSLKDSIENYSKEERAAKYENASPYGLFIDEINRGNISQIFGELITVIEDTKRLGKDEVIVELPYSKSKFGVPPNLYIIGTMNTADRSVESLDTALRRRFCFEEMLPRVELLSPSAIYCKLLWDYKDVGWKDSEFVAKENNLFELIGVSQDFKDNRESIWSQMNKDKNLKIIKNDYFKDFKYSGVNLENLLQIINDRIEILLDRDHTIGHSFFIGINSFEDLKTVFQKNIVPLLQEYFFGDYEKIALVLGEGFVECIEANENNVKFAKWNGRSLETPEITRSFRLKNNIESIEEAIKLLLNE